MRDEDVSGVSGTGKVAEGIVFSNGITVVGWCKEIPSAVFYNSLEEAVEIHGHKGKTRFVFVDCLKGES